jgi:hypothetical protein
VIRTIIGVCQQFSSVRFDAAMTLAKRHIQRLWYPAPGTGGAIASRAEHAISTEEFNARIPNEFWREVVDRCAVEAPNTLLLAEAFWMMEGYFVRTLGMHRVYNSAFMNMLKNEENAKYRATIKNTLEFDPEILKRFVNFMNNPDEETAVAQFGKGDKYFGICTLLVTMPGLPMFGHGQIEGFEEKYGMEYRRSYRDEKPDGWLVDRHEREIFPLMKKRYLFSGSAEFRIYDLFTQEGGVNENVFAYSNRSWARGDERALIFYNNSYYETSGWIKMSDPAIPQSDGGKSKDSLSEALGLHGEGSRFTLLREQKSNLWFIRSSKEICEKGLFVSLKGYETQVFLDIYEVADDERGRWARLHHDLQGRGVADPQDAVMDIFLGELYWRFSEFFKPEIITKLHGFFVEGAQGEAAKSFIASLKEPAEAFFEAAARFIAGGDGKFDAWTPQKDGVPLEFDPADKKELWAEFEGYIERLIRLSAYAETKTALAEAKTASAETAGNRLLTTLAGRMQERQALCAAALGYSLLALLRPIIGTGAPDLLHNSPDLLYKSAGSLAANLGFDHWRLDRKLRDIYRSIGASKAEAWRITDVSKSVLSRAAPADVSPYAAALAETTFNPCRFAELLIAENYLKADFRRLLGINVFEDVTWFNKEGFADALFYGSLFLVLESDSAFWEPSRRKDAPKNAAQAAPITWEERVARIGAVAEALSQAEASAEYRLDELINALDANGKPAAKSGVKAELKNAAQKKPADKGKPAKP